ncbi:MAG TPA: chemotaxis protein CheB [Polyangia bacterium]|nr:chemotaxis protein CheB [Polyangia bacterium]
MDNPPVTGHEGDGPDGPDPTGPLIVGVGASAGGLEALTALLANLTLDSTAVIVVQHLSPAHETMLPALLARASTYKVALAKDGTAVAPNHVYVIPPNADLAILRGVLQTMPLPANRPRGPHLPVDYFFRSLADDQGSRAIGVVLSGTGTDGTFGLKAIKEVGGITFAQDPSSAKFESMPRSAIESGWADFVLPADEIAKQLLQVAQHPYLARVRAPATEVQPEVNKLIVLIRAAFGNDLTAYKPTTIDRRVERRMALHRIEKQSDYVKYVLGAPDELGLLYKDMLINVTSFFRDAEPFEALRTRIFPRILETKSAGSQIRVWVPACSTGEEVYSIAIELLEFLGDRAPEYRIQVFGTDVDEDSIKLARRGLFPENIELDVSAERLQRFFFKTDGKYQVSRRVRDMVVFSNQNIIKDAPFSRLDLVSCRNLLIYLRPAIQKKVLRILNYSLLPTGHLMLGTSETVGDASEYFRLIDRKNKIYAKRHVASAGTLDISFGVQPVDARRPAEVPTNQRTTTNLATAVEHKIVELYAPAGVVVNEDLDIVHIRGRTGAYLEPMPGAPSFNILRLARPALHADLRRAIHEAKSRRERASVQSHLSDERGNRVVTLEVVPVVEPETKAPFLLVLFHEASPADAAPGAADVPAADDGRATELERELMVTKEYLQSTIEELESANEELKSSNEELQSSNEELQSTNEELETSKEELQSSNEELTTVNEELQNRMIELQLANDDLHNVLSAIGEAIVIVGLDLRIRRYTHVAEEMLNLVTSDIGRSVSQLNAFVVGERVEDLASRVIEYLTPIEKELLCADRRRYRIRVLPYKTLDHAIKGAVIILVDLQAHEAETAAGGATKGEL